MMRTPFSGTMLERRTSPATHYSDWSNARGWICLNIQEQTCLSIFQQEYVRGDTLMIFFWACFIFRRIERQKTPENITKHNGPTGIKENP